MKQTLHQEGSGITEVEEIRQEVESRVKKGKGENTMRYSKKLTSQSVMVHIQFVKANNFRNYVVKNNMEGKNGSTLEDIAVGTRFQNRIPVPQEMMPRISKCGYNQLKASIHQKK